MDEAEVIRAKRLRGEVIETLYPLYGEEARLSTVRGLLRYKGYSADRDLKRALKYLADAGYIGISRAESFWDADAGLTPEGVRLAEGDEKDMGVMFDE